MTIAALIGAKSFENSKECVKEFEKCIRFISQDTFVNVSKKKYVILFLEGEFGSKTRSKKMIMNELQKSINRKLKWINCSVSVLDSDTYNSKIFKIVS